jgi:hypothetical protein
MRQKSRKLKRRQSPLRSSMALSSELVQRWIAATDDVALAFAYEPDEKVEASLERMRQNLNAEFCALFPGAAPETMATGVDCIIGEIQKRRREIEVGAQRVKTGQARNLN